MIGWLIGTTLGCAWGWFVCTKIIDPVINRTKGE